MTSPNPWQAPDAAPTVSAPIDTNAAPWTAAPPGSPPPGTFAPPPMQQPPPPYGPSWPGAFGPPPPRQPMSSGQRALLISLVAVVAVLLIVGVSVLAVLVARDAADESQPGAPAVDNSGLVNALDELDENTSWTVAEELGGEDEFETWAARLYSSSRDPVRSKDTAVTMLQGAGYTNVVVMQYVEPRDTPYEWVVNAEKDAVYASVYIGGDIQYEYDDEGTEASVEAPVGGSAINVHLSESQYESD